MPKVRILVALGSLLAALPAAAQADPIFEFSTTVNAAKAAVPNPPGFTSSMVDIGSPGSLGFTTNSSAGVNAGLAGGADINFGQVSFLANPNGDGVSTPFTVFFNYQLTMTSGGDTATVNLAGSITGQAMSNATSSAFNSVVNIYSFTAAPALKLGGYVYSLSIKSATGPGSVSNPGTFQVNVSVVAVPEPSSIVMLGLAGGSAAAFALRRRRRA